MFKSEYKIIKKSGLFDEQYYLKTYEDVRKADSDPIKHYMKNGWKEGRNPSEKFDTNFYLKNYPDVKDTGINPLVHYIKYRREERRKTNPLDITQLQPHTISKFKKLISLGKYAKNNPHLISRTLREIKLHGIKKTLTKIKNKSYKFDNLSSMSQNFIDVRRVLDAFNTSPIVPKFNTTKAIDIIIPVYNGKEYLVPLFESIFKNTSMSYRLLVCDDKSSDSEVLPLLHKIKNDNPNITMILLENEVNLGFIKTVNKLAALTQNHFVLLNTDTEVPPCWIERLMYPIFEMDTIASTTPFTNAGTICSFQNYLEDNPIFEGLSVEEVDKAFGTVNFDKTLIEIPTGVGFCMGVNKTLVDTIGMFDEVFGKGYGEENDWCQRAIKNGYKNLHITNLFVYHKHGGSFSSEEKQQLIRKNLATLNKKHPTYNEQVQTLIVKDELDILRKMLVFRLLNSKNHSVLIFDHNLVGGAHTYIEEDICHRVDKGQTVCLVRYDFNITKKYFIKLITKQQEITLEASTINEIEQLLNLVQFNEIFINSFVMYPDIKFIITLIVDIKKRMSLKLIVPIHDFFPVCPNYTLLDETMTYCRIPDDSEKCNRCLAQNKGEFKIFETERSVKNWRDTWNELFQLSDTVLCFSNSSKDIFLKAYPAYKEKVSVIPHDISGRYAKMYQKDENNKEIRIGILGGINEAKGALVIENLVKHIEKNALNAKVILIGQINIPITSPYFEVTGYYDRAKLPEIVKEKNITQFLIPSICPETFSYTTDEIMQMGYPLIVFNLGAPAERVKDYDLGKVIEINKINEVIFES